MSARAFQDTPPRPPDDLPASYSLYADAGKSRIECRWIGELTPVQLIAIIDALANLVGVTVTYSVTTTVSLPSEEAKP